MSSGTGLDLDGIRRELAGDAGQLQPLGLGRVVAGPGAVDSLAEVVADLPGGSDVVVLAAATPMSTDGRDLRTAVEQALDRSVAVDWVVVGPDDGQVHADEATVAAATAAAAGAGCVVTVGSGTITDIGKAAAPAAAPLVIVQTATSVNGYADPFSVLLRHGVKRTTPSRWPDALVIDPAVLQDAPPDLNRAGAWRPHGHVHRHRRLVPGYRPEHPRHRSRRPGGLLRRPALPPHRREAGAGARRAAAGTGRRGVPPIRTICLRNLDP